MPTHHHASDATIIRMSSGLVPLMLSSLVGWACAADYHLAANGDDANDGTTPRTSFRTLAGACRKVPAGKHVIQVAAGTYDEKTSAQVPKGVSIVGAGKGKTVFTWQATRSLEKNPMGHDADAFLIQVKDTADASISGLTINGSMAEDRRAHGGIIAREVSAFSIRDCELRGLEFCGVWLAGATKSSVQGCCFEDCGHPSKVSCSGALQVGPLTDCAIHGNVIREHRGAYGIKAWNPAWKSPTDWGGIWGNMVKLVRTRFHDNDIDLRQQGAWGNGQPNMDLELWASDLQDCEMYGNRFRECVSLVGGGKSPRTIRVHHNLHLLKPGYNYAIEAGMQGIEIDRNYFQNGAGTISSFGETIRNLHIHHNTFDGVMDINVLGFPGLIDFRFEHNIVVVKKDMPLLSLTKFAKDSADLVIARNVFIKEGGTALAKPMIHGKDGAPSRVTISGNAYWNWNSAEGASALAMDPGLVRGEQGDRLLHLKPASRVLAAGCGHGEVFGKDR